MHRAGLVVLKIGRHRIEHDCLAAHNQVLYVDALTAKHKQH
jgi:hypothetical protein